MDAFPSMASFHSTSWTLVMDAQHRRESLERLLRAYWAPIYTCIRRHGFNGHEASDLTQEFMTRIVLGRDLVKRATPERGRFRSLLKHSLKNFLIDEFRAGRHTRGKSEGVSSPGTSSTASSGSIESDQAGRGLEAVVLDEVKSQEFDRRWAAAIVEHTLRRVEDACVLDGMSSHWRAFDLCVLGPMLRHTCGPTMAELMLLVGAIDEAQASNMIQTVKRRFRRALREIVAETVEDPSLIDQELDDLRGHIGH